MADGHGVWADLWAFRRMRPKPMKLTVAFGVDSLWARRQARVAGPGGTPDGAKDWVGGREKLVD